MTKNGYAFTIDAMHPSSSTGTGIRLEGLATLTGESATFPAEALLLRPTEDQADIMTYVAPGSNVFIIASNLEQNEDALLIIDQIFLDESSFEDAMDELEIQKRDEKMRAMNRSLEFLTWVDRCSFPRDFESDLVKLGVEPDVAFGLRLHMTAQKGRSKTMAELFQDNIDGGEYKAALLTYLVDMQRQYIDITARHATQKNSQRTSNDSEPGL